MDDKTLRPGDARKIFEELLPAQNKSYMLGLALKLPLPIVEAIHSQYQNPRHRLFHVIIKFLEQAEPRPTWRDIVETLNSRAVNLPDLARRVEAAHCPDSITTSSSPQGPRRLIPASVAAHGSHWQPIHTAPGMDKTLRPDDAEEIFEELLPAQNKSLELGLALNMPPPEVEAIHSQYKDPHDRLLRVIIKFLEQMGPRPTWRVIVEALRSCAVGLPGIARRVEAAHCPDSITISSSRPGPRRLIPASVAAHGSHWQPIHTAPGMDKTLRPDDAVKILEELLPAQNKSHMLGLALKLPLPIVETIHSHYQNPQDRLLHVIIAFLEQMGPRSTWRVIVEALRSRAVGLQGIARRVEAAHCPDSITISSSPPGPRCLIPVSLSSQLTLLSSSREVEEMILMLNKRFHRLKNTVRDGLVEHKVHVKRVVDALTSFPAEDDDYRMVFLQNHIGDLFKVADNFDLFTTMNFHWKYFDPSLLETITKEFEEVVEVKAQMEAYKSDLRQFRMKTPLTLFCHTQKRKRINISLEFQQMVAEFEWPETVTLEDVEQFRQQYAYEYNLQQCTLMVAKFLDLESSKPQDLHSPSNFPCTSSVVTLQKDEKKVSKKSKILRLLWCL
ncbi:hypothetical protein GBAR_LOCUS27042 [Geodia barretti]|uniref:Uncharacterized protein n=1 Tax=Geodia barretti TaxID=519541 RepID=A0AA35TLH9_GEOBA|nr:hypothetical protein GBAR_LOCUS27042 [Geodia barretti]